MRLIIFASLILWLGHVLFLENKTSAQTPDPNFELSFCKEHGGINCSIIKPDASVVCNDGTIDESFIIYGVPECQETIENLANQQSYFMAESGCVPPSEMACTNNESYQNLYNHLVNLGLENSELGKNELDQCLQQKEEYKIKNLDYKQCLSENKKDQFDLIGGSYTKPLLKTIFCPIFYGDKSYFDPEINLCLCEEGYFMSDGKCEDPILICQSKYGPSAIYEQGDCVCKNDYNFNLNKTQCVPVEKTIKPPPHPIPFISTVPTPSITPPISDTKIAPPTQPNY